MLPKYLTIEEYSKSNDSIKSLYELQYQEYVYNQPDSEGWVDISETKASYTNRIIRKVYKIKDASN